MTGRFARLKRRADFVRVARKGRKAVTPGMVVQAAPRGGSAARVGFTASRKVGGAVARNRARRRLRALADQILPAEACTDRDYVLIARAATVRRPFAELSVDLSRALAKLGASRVSASAPAQTSASR